MIRIAILAVAGLALTGCAGSTAAFTGTGDNTASVLGNLQGCHRIYRGSISAGLGAGASGSFEIECEPKAGSALGEGVTPTPSEPIG